MDEAVVLVPEMWAAFPAIARTAAGLRAGAAGGRGGGSGVFVIRYVIVGLALHQNLPRLFSQPFHP